MVYVKMEWDNATYILKVYILKHLTLSGFIIYDVRVAVDVALTKYELITSII